MLTILTALPLLTAALALDVKQGRPILDGVHINGHGPYRFLIDTGAQSNRLDIRLAQQNGLKPTFQVELATAAGSTMAPGASGVTFRLSSGESAKSEILFTPLDAVHRLSKDIQGVLGQAFLANFDYLLDLDRRKLEFGKRELPGPRAEFRLIDGRLAIHTSLGTLVLDSGTDRVILFGRPAALPSLLLETASGFTGATSTAKRKLTIEGREIRYRDPLMIPRPANTPEDGLLPAKLFRSIYVSNSGRFIVLQ